MKTLPTLLCSLLLVAVGQAQPAPANPSTGKAAAPTAAVPAKKNDTPKKASPAKIEGIEVARGEKGFLGVQLVEGTFKISFYDAKKVPKAPDVVRAVLRWDPKYKVGKERVVLNVAEDGKSLASPRTIRPPYNFKLFITLLNDAAEAEDPAGETHVIDFRG